MAAPPSRNAVQSPMQPTFRGKVFDHVISRRIGRGCYHPPPFLEPYVHLSAHTARAFRYPVRGGNVTKVILVSFRGFGCFMRSFRSRKYSLSRYGFASSLRRECLRILVSKNFRSLFSFVWNTHFLFLSGCQYLRAIHLFPLSGCLRLAQRHVTFQM